MRSSSADCATASSSSDEAGSGTCSDSEDYCIFSSTSSDFSLIDGTSDLYSRPQSDAEAKLTARQSDDERQTAAGQLPDAEWEYTLLLRDDSSLADASGVLAEVTIIFSATQAECQAAVPVRQNETPPAQMTPWCAADLPLAWKSLPCPTWDTYSDMSHTQFLEELRRQEAEERRQWLEILSESMHPGENLPAPLQSQWPRRRGKDSPAPYTAKWRRERPQNRRRRDGRHACRGLAAAAELTMQADDWTVQGRVGDVCNPQVELASEDSDREGDTKSTSSNVVCCVFDCPQSLSQTDLIRQSEVLLAWSKSWRANHLPQFLAKDFHHFPTWCAADLPLVGDPWLWRTYSQTSYLRRLEEALRQDEEEKRRWQEILSFEPKHPGEDLPTPLQSRWPHLGGKDSPGHHTVRWKRECTGGRRRRNGRHACRSKAAAAELALQDEDWAVQGRSGSEECQQQHSWLLGYDDHPADEACPCLACRQAQQDVINALHECNSGFSSWGSFMTDISSTFWNVPPPPQQQLRPLPLSAAGLPAPPQRQHQQRKRSGGSVKAADSHKGAEGSKDVKGQQRKAQVKCRQRYGKLSSRSHLVAYELALQDDDWII